MNTFAQLEDSFKTMVQFSKVYAVLGELQEIMHVYFIKLEKEKLKGKLYSYSIIQTTIDNILIYKFPPSF